MEIRSNGNITVNGASRMPVPTSVTQSPHTARRKAVAPPKTQTITATQAAGMVRTHAGGASVAS